MAKVIITTNNKYAKYLSKHLQEEHPKTKGHIMVSSNKKHKHIFVIDRKNPAYDYCPICKRKVLHSKREYDYKKYR